MLPSSRLKPGLIVSEELARPVIVQAPVHRCAVECC